MNKKVLILTASTGGGHNKAARALKDAYLEWDYEIEIVDILKLIHSLIENVFIDGYDLLYSTLPWLYRSMYRHSDNRIFRADASKVVGRIFRNKMLNIINREKPCIIVGTHAFTVGIVSRLKKRKKINIPFICIVTDFKAHATYFSDYVDAYITGSDDTKIDMIIKGIPEGKIHSCGIPIDKAFWNIEPQNNNRTVMIMGGSLCNLDMIGLLETLTSCEEKFNIIAICGRDEDMYCEAHRYADAVKDREITVYSFTHRIPELMSKSDILITKPGGLTISEAIVSRLPMIVPESLPGQEEDNLRFLLTNELAYYTRSKEHLRNLVDDLMRNGDKLKNIVNNMKSIREKYSVEEVMRLSDNLCGIKKENS